MHSNHQYKQLLLGMRPDCNLNFRGELGRCLLHWVVGDPDSTRIVLQYRPHLNVFDDNGASPLLLAIAHRQPESARLLVEAGCDAMLVGLLLRMNVALVIITPDIFRRDALWRVTHHSIRPLFPSLSNMFFNTSPIGRSEANGRMRRRNIDRCDWLQC